MLLLTVLIKQKIVTHSVGKTEDIVYTSALEGMVRLDCGFIGRMLQQQGVAVNGGVGGGRPGL